MKIFLIALTLFMSIGLSTGYAKDTGIVVGEGARTCKAYLKARGRKRNNFIVWVHGYVSAFNALDPSVLNIMAGHDYFWVQKRLEALCKANPDQYFNDAVVALIGEVHPTGISLAEPNQLPKIIISTD